MDKQVSTIEVGDPLFFLILAVVVLYVSLPRLLPILVVGYKHLISPRELKKMLTDPNPPFLIDVRTPSETAEQDNRIEGAHIIPLDTIRHALKHDADLREAKGGDVVIICRSGQRAGIAAWLMKRSGFEHCFILSGGIEAWKEDESGI